MNRYKGIAIPTALTDYLETTEQYNVNNMTPAQMAEEADTVLHNEQNDPDTPYTASQIRAVARFVEKLKAIK